MNLFTLCSLAITFLCSVTCCANAAATPEADSAHDAAYDAYNKPGMLVALPDGRKIHLFCSGAGSPTVILTAGFSDWSAQWNKVQGPIGQKTRACSWDRAGYGYSDPSPLPQDVLHTTADLEAALRAANIVGPYVLVGHSMGGFESLLFADRHRSQVVGMVLVDPSIPDQFRLTQTSAPKLSAALEVTHEQYIQKKTACAKKIQNGVLTATSADPDNCFSYNPAYSEELKEAMRHLDGNPSRWLTRASLMAQLNLSSREVIDRKRNYADMPLRVLTAGDPDTFPSNFDAKTLAQVPAFKAELLHGHDALAALSTNGANIVVPETTHYIQLIKSEVVVSTISQVVDEIRASAQLAGKYSRSKISQ